MANPLRPAIRTRQSRTFRYLAGRLVTLVATVVIGTYITLVLANLGGYADQTVRYHIDMRMDALWLGGWMSEEPIEVRLRLFEEATQERYEAAGLNQPFLLRTFRWLGRGLTLNWGQTGAGFMYGQPALEVHEVILIALPRTLLLFGTSNLFLFFASILFGLRLSRNPNGMASRMLAMLTPLSSVPAWAYAFILMYLAMTLFGIYWARTNVTWPADMSNPGELAFLVKQLTIPFLALLFSKIFQSIYIWQTIFVLYSDEHYVELARAKGLSPGLLERRYLVRPALPVILTSFALVMLGIWQESIPLEFFFNINGIGRLLLFALDSVDIGVMLGLIVTFTYLLALTMFLLEIARVLVDPRARVDGQQGQVRPTFARRRARHFITFPALRRSDPDLSRPGPNVRVLVRSFRRGLETAGRFARLFFRQRAGMLGLTVILFMVGVSAYAVIAMPAGETFSRWRNTADWEENPRNALPTWVNLFRRPELPETIFLLRDDPSVIRERTEISPGMWQVTLRCPLEYTTTVFPQDVRINLYAGYDRKVPLVGLTWRTPDGRVLDMGTRTLNATETIIILSQQRELLDRFDTHNPERYLFADPADPLGSALPGKYELIMTAFVFEPQADLQADVYIYGRVSGLAGTDALRRDLIIPLAWGTPVALMFGLLAALGTSLLSLFFAAAGAWLGGWVDWLVQRLTEINMILPFLPVCMMVFVLYSNTVWAILGTAVALSIFGNSILVYRSIFLQVREAGYVEAALAYGAGDGRVILRYLFPRVFRTLIPQLITLVPAFVFFEAMLGGMGMSDPVVPSWGMLLRDTLNAGLAGPPPFQLLASLGMLMLIGVSFSLVGVALNRVLDPQARES